MGLDESFDNQKKEDAEKIDFDTYGPTKNIIITPTKDVFSKDLVMPSWAYWVHDETGV